ncbi:acetyltransferase [Acinetobacter baumannii 25493_4]|nr:acetyltransferase [Acinetobacter baumannii 25493_4]
MLNYQLVGKTDYESAVEFALYTRQLLFPEIYHGQIPKDLQNF